MKYIDVDKLKEEIERLYDGEAPKHDQQCDFNDGYFMGISVISNLIDSLQQEQPELPRIARAEYYYNKGVYEGISQGRADALKILDEFMKRKADPIIVIKQQERLEVDLEKEYTEFVVSDPVYSKLVNGIVGKSIARHFYELGKNAK